jgi:hypothetical protein
MTRKRFPSQARTQQKLWRTAERIPLVASPAPGHEIAAAEVTFGLQMTVYRFDGGSASQLALDHSEDAGFMAGDEDAARVVRVMPR